MSTPARRRKNGCGMPKRVRTDAFTCQRRDDGGGFLSTTFDQRMDTEAGDRLAATIKKDPLGRCTLRHQWRERLRGDGPEGAMTDLVAFAQQPYRRLSQVDIGDGQLRRLARPRTGVVKEEQQRVVVAPLLGVAIRGIEQGVHLRLFQIWHHGLDGLLEGNATDISAPGDMLGTVRGDEAGQSADGGQALIARGRRAMTHLLDMTQKTEDARCTDLLHR